MRKGDSIVIDPATRKVTHVNGEPCAEMTPELEALVEEALGPAEAPKKTTRRVSSEVDI